MTTTQMSLPATPSLLGELVGINLRAISPRFVSLFTLYLILVGGNYGVYHSLLSFKVIHHVLMTALLLWWLVRRGLPNIALSGPLAMMAIWAIGSNAFGLDPRVAQESAWHWLINVVMVFVLVDWIRQGQLPAIGRGLYYAAGIIAATMILQAIASPGQRPAGAVLVVNLAGAMLGALLIPVWYGRMHARGWHLVIWVCLVTAALILNASRGAWLAVIVSAVICAGLRWPQIRAYLLPVAALGVMVVLASLSSSGRMAGDNLRLHLWQSALQISEDYPFGVGAGVFPQAYRPYATLPDDDRMTGAHNHYLTLLAELGWPALLIGAWLAWNCLRTLPRPLETHHIAALAGLGGVLVHMLVDNYPVTGYAFVVAVFAAILWSKPLPHLSNVPLRLWNILLICWLAIYGVRWAVWDTAEYYYRQSQSSGSIQEAQQAVSLDPRLRVYQLNVARLAGEDVQGAVGDEVNLEEWALTNYGRVWG